jgi:hypothetical protein
MLKNDLYNLDYYSGVAAIPGRKLVKRGDFSSFMKFGDGKVSFKSCVDQSGNVVYSEVIPQSTTITNKTTISNLMSTSLKYKFEKKTNAPCLECGQLYFEFVK